MSLTVLGEVNYVRLFCFQIANLKKLVSYFKVENDRN